MSHLFANQVNILEDKEVSEVTQRMLDYYAWRLRNANINDLITEEQKTIVRKRMDKVFTEDLIFEGEIPYVSFYNLLGIKNKLTYDDEDAMLGIVAPPGKGKSSLAMTFARFLDSSFTIDRVIFTSEAFQQFLEDCTKVLKGMKQQRERGETPKNPLSGTAIVLDEGVYMIFSGDAQSKQGKQSQKLFSIIRALNLLVIVNITNFKKINKGVVDDRILGMWRIEKRGFIGFLPRRRIGWIREKNRDLIFPKAVFSERVGYISKKCDFWKQYEVKKATFLDDAVTENN